MPEQISYDENARIIKVISIGDIKYSEWKDSLSKIKEISNKYNCNRLLVDISQQTSTPKDTIELFLFGKELPINLRYAIVSTDEKSRNHKFLETVATNRGKLVSFFSDQNDALAWLKRFD